MVQQGPFNLIFLLSVFILVSLASFYAGVASIVGGKYRSMYLLKVVLKIHEKLDRT